LNFYLKILIYISKLLKGGKMETWITIMVTQVLLCLVAAIGIYEIHKFRRKIEKLLENKN